jgi:hypothetical protein
MDDNNNDVFSLRSSSSRSCTINFLQEKAVEATKQNKEEKRIYTTRGGHQVAKDVLSLTILATGAMVIREGKGGFCGSWSLAKRQKVADPLLYGSLYYSAFNMFV